MFRKTNKRSVKSLFLLLPLLLLQLLVNAQALKVVGYLPSYRFDLNSSIDYCKVTNLNIAFANPDSEGNLQIDNFDKIINTAKQQNANIVICISLGGGELPDNLKKHWSDLIDKPENRPGFIKKIVDFVETKNLDGVDFDLEWSAVTTGYSDFVIALNDSLKTHNKLLSAALPATYRYPQITNAALQVFDFVNIMAYDATGPWSPNKPGQHSSYNFAEQAVTFWKNQNVAKENLVLGVPFYGYNFDNSSNVFSFTYATMVSKNNSYADIDQVGKAYYNGRPTIEKKVELAAKEVSGIMIWELGQDKYDSYSLLSTIHNKFTSLGKITTGLCGNVVSANEIADNGIKIYPNPATDNITIESNNIDKIEISVFNIYGQKLLMQSQVQMSTYNLNIANLPRGVYLIKTKNRGNVKVHRVIFQ